MASMDAGSIDEDAGDEASRARDNNNNNNNNNKPAAAGAGLDLGAPPLPEWAALDRHGWCYDEALTADENYLDLAYLLARNSEAKDGHMGCCAVKGGAVVGQAINAALFGFARSDVHAEAALVSDAAKRGSSVAGASIYVTRAPCQQCYKLVAIAGVKRIVAPDAMVADKCLDSARTLGIECVVLRDSDARHQRRDSLIADHRDDDAIKAAREQRKLLKRTKLYGKVKRPSAEDRADDGGVS